MEAAATDERPYVRASDVGAYFARDCERFLLHQAVTRDGGLRQATLDPVAEAHTARGIRFEREVWQELQRMADRGQCGAVDLTENECFEAEGGHFASWLRQAAPSGEDAPPLYVFQPPVQVSAAVFGGDADKLRFSKALPDLLRVHCNEITVIDIKSSRELKISHQGQLAFYVQVLRHHLRCADGACAQLRVAATAEVWRPSAAQPGSALHRPTDSVIAETVDVSAALELVRELVANRLPALADGSRQAAWRLRRGSCAGCPSLAECRGDAEGTVRALGSPAAGEADWLAAEAGSAQLADIEDWWAHSGGRGAEVRARAARALGCAPGARQPPELHALKTRKPCLRDAPSRSTMLSPEPADWEFYVALLADPREWQPAGLVVRGVVSGGGDPIQTHSQGPGEEAALRALAEGLQYMPEQATVQVFVLGDDERRELTRLVLDGARGTWGATAAQLARAVAPILLDPHDMLSLGMCGEVLDGVDAVLKLSASKSGPPLAALQLAAARLGLKDRGDRLSMAGAIASELAARAGQPACGAHGELQAVVQQCRLLAAARAVELSLRAPAVTSIEAAVNDLYAWPVPGFATKWEVVDLLIGLPRGEACSVSDEELLPLADAAPLLARRAQWAAEVVREARRHPAALGAVPAARAAGGHGRCAGGVARRLACARQLELLVAAADLRRGRRARERCPLLRVALAQVPPSRAADPWAECAVTVSRADGGTALVKCSFGIGCLLRSALKAHGALWNGDGGVKAWSGSPGAIAAALGIPEADLPGAGCPDLRLEMALEVLDGGELLVPAGNFYKGEWLVQCWDRQQQGGAGVPAGDPPGGAVTCAADFADLMFAVTLPGQWGALGAVTGVAACDINTAPVEDKRYFSKDPTVWLPCLGPGSAAPMAWARLTGSCLPMVGCGGVIELRPRVYDATTPKAVAALLASAIREEAAPPASILSRLVCGGPGALEGAPTVTMSAAATQELVDAAGERRHPLSLLTPSQRAAYEQTLRDRVQVVWGPPGTGKTFYLACAIVGWLDAALREPADFSILITAFTKSAIAVLVKEVRTLVDTMARRFPGTGWDEVVIEGGEEDPDTRSASRSISRPAADHAELPDAPCGSPALLAVGAGALGPDEPEPRWPRQETPRLKVLGATVWKVHDNHAGESFDAVVIDEASQLPVADAAAAVEKVADADARRGRLVAAGDHQQLPPIRKASCPQPARGEPLIYSSLLLALMRDRYGEVLVDRFSALSRGLAPSVAKLCDNLRSNTAIGDLTATLYGADYRFAPCPGDPPGDKRLLDVVPAPALDEGQWPGTLWAALSADRGWLSGLLSVELQVCGAGCPGAGAELALQAEAAVVCGLAACLRAHCQANGGGYDALVVAPKRRQKAAISRIGGDLFSQVDTAERAQGRTADVVFVALGTADGPDAAFVYDLSRVNVAFSRARRLCVLVAPCVAPPPAVCGSPDSRGGFGHVSAFRQRAHRLRLRASLAPGEDGAATAEVHILRDQGESLPAGQLPLHGDTPQSPLP
eukprot:TRINITY_DN3773_c0_g1_i2.p1 TRINITY_DN3773_c0_g1~~TRINITY_DN3773_c0_g1_i2.p1  ORF type:complete len:1520 (+),score=390.15 TRINITY_DN3773_c0_g1_i2:74-4633(+)